MVTILDRRLNNDRKRFHHPLSAILQKDWIFQSLSPTIGAPFDNGSRRYVCLSDSLTAAEPAHAASFCWMSERRWQRRRSRHKNGPVELVPTHRYTLGRTHLSYLYEVVSSNHFYHIGQWFSFTARSCELRPLNMKHASSWGSLQLTKTISSQKNSPVQNP